MNAVPLLLEEPSRVVSPEAKTKPHFGESPLEMQIRIGALPEPIPLDEVRKTKQKALRDARKNCGAPFLLRFYLVHFTLMSLGIILGLFALGGGLYWLLSGLGTVVISVGKGVAWNYVGAQIGFSCVCFVVCLGSLSCAAFVSEHRIPYWRRLQYNRCFYYVMSPVPEEAQLLAREIALRLPEAKPFVDELAYTADPFLGVEYRGKAYYFLKW